MGARSEGASVGYALCEGTTAKHGDGGAVGVVIRDRRHHRIASASRRVTAASPARSRFAAVAMALRSAHASGIRSLVVYCHDRSVVDRINRREPTDRETLAPCLEVRALLNMFRKAEVRSIPWIANLEAIWLARKAAAELPPEDAQRLQPTLPLDAA